MITCEKHHFIDSSPDADECPSCSIERTLAGLPSGHRIDVPLQIINILETCLGFLNWLVKHPMDFAAVVIGEQDARALLRRALVARYVKTLV